MRLWVMKVLFDNVFLGSVILVSAILTFVLVIAIFAILVIAIGVVSEEDFPDFFVEIDFYFGDFFVVIDFYYDEKSLDVCQETDFDFVSYVYGVGDFYVSNLIDSWILV